MNEGTCIVMMNILFSGHTFLFVQDCLSPLSMQALPASPESLCIVEMGSHESNEETGEAASQGGLFLNIGLQVCHLFYSHIMCVC